MKNTEPDFKHLLREAGHKATPGRMLLLKILWQEPHPVDVAHLQESVRGALDKVTLYRALSSLVTSGIVRQIDLRHGRTLYELNALREHHHHIICTGCGSIEDTACGTADLQKAVAKHSTRFKKITDHSLEFFGVCTSCDA